MKFCAFIEVANLTLLVLVFLCHYFSSLRSIKFHFFYYRNLPWLLQRCQTLACDTSPASLLHEHGRRYDQPKQISSGIKNANRKHLLVYSWLHTLSRSLSTVVVNRLAARANVAALNRHWNVRASQASTKPFFKREGYRFAGRPGPAGIPDPTSTREYTGRVQ